LCDGLLALGSGNLSWADSVAVHLSLRCVRAGYVFGHAPASDQDGRSNPTGDQWLAR